MAAFNTIPFIHPIRNACDPQLAEFVDDIGNGISNKVHLNIFQREKSEISLACFVFPDEILQDPISCFNRIILVSTNKQVEIYNRNLLRRLSSPSRIYYACDFFKECVETGFTPPQPTLEYCSIHPPQGFPPHDHLLKLEGIYLLLQNFSISHGLVKNAQVN
jgi:hypothetical protein